MLFGLPIRHVHGAKDVRNGLLHASKSTYATGSWSEVYWGKDYYMLVGLLMRQVHGARDIWKGIITC